MRLEFGAPWSRSLKAASVFAVMALVAVAAIGIALIPARFLLERCLMVALPLTVLTIAFLGSVSGYTLTATVLEVHRPLRTTMIGLGDLLSVAGDAEALKSSVRLFGNGGIFAITGFFWNRKLGRYRAYATDPARAVILKFRQRTIVVTPHDPQHFIVRARTQLAAQRREERA